MIILSIFKKSVYGWDSCSKSFLDSGAKFMLSGEAYKRMEISQQDIVGNFFLLPDEYSVERKLRFLKYMLRFLLALQKKRIEVQVNIIFLP